MEQLRITLLGEAPKAAETDPEAYALYLQARHLRLQFTPESLEQSYALNKQALAIDPRHTLRRETARRGSGFERVRT